MSQMVLIELQQRLKNRIRTAAQELFGVEIDQLNAEVPPRPELGDVAFPVSFELAKLVKLTRGEKIAPRAIAEKLKVELESIDEVSYVEVAGPGYINVFFNRPKLLKFFGEDSPKRGSDADQPKKMVEHTSINPNKAAHIGHVRNAVLGDTFVRILQAAGNRVEHAVVGAEAPAPPERQIVGAVGLEHVPDVERRRTIVHRRVAQREIVGGLRRVVGIDVARILRQRVVDVGG